MPTLIGIPTGKMIRTSVISDTDDLGLTRLTETYAFATSEFQTFRTRLINFTPYNTVMNCVYPTPSTTYPYVVVETASIREDAGGISMATIQYVGILKPTKASSGDISWLPPAKQKLQPLNSPYNPLSVIVDFIYYSDIEPKDLGLLKSYGIGSLLPSTINGTILYKSIKAPFTEENKPSGFRNGNPAYERPIGASSTGSTPPRPPTYYKSVYIGMACSAHFSERVGLFHKVTNTYQDSGFFQTSGARDSYTPFGSFAV